jgi:cation:H+ antiporter
MGSNMFNILAVIGIAITINPMESIDPAVLLRDWMVMLGLTLLLLVMIYGFNGKKGRINRVEGTILFLCYIAYNTYLGMNILG